MSTSKDIDQTTAAPSGDASSAARSEAPAPATEPTAEPIKAEATKVEGPVVDPTSPPQNFSMPMIDPDSVAPRIDAQKSEAPRSRSNPPTYERVAPQPGAGDHIVTLFTAAPPRAAAPARSRKFALLAATVALAAAFGALVGAFGAAGIGSPPPAPSQSASAAAAGADTRGLQSEIAQMRTDLSAIKTSVDSVTRTSSAQFAKFSERVDRAERAQADPAAKLAKAIEALERLERRTDAAKETTGSVATPQPAASAAAVAPRLPQAAQPPQPAIVHGWSLQDVYRGVALIQGGRFGTMEVEAGDLVPGLGRIEAIRKQDGHWVVVTAKGLIVAAR